MPSGCSNERVFDDPPVRAGRRRGARRALRRESRFPRAVRAGPPGGLLHGGGQRERLERQLAEGVHPFAILDGEAIAGTINVFHIVRESLQSCTIGYWIDQARNGRGLATGAVEDVVAYAFGELDLHRVEAATLVDNVASQRVLEKAAFERVGVARRFLHINDEWRDFVLYQRVAD